MLVEVWMTAVLSWGDYFGALVSFFFFFHLGIGWFCSREPPLVWFTPLEYLTIVLIKMSHSIHMLSIQIDTNRFKSV